MAMMDACAAALEVALWAAAEARGLLLLWFRAHALSMTDVYTPTAASIRCAPV